MRPPQMGQFRERGTQANFTTASLTPRSCHAYATEQHLAPANAAGLTQTDCLPKMAHSQKRGSVLQDKTDHESGRTSISKTPSVRDNPMTGNSPLPSTVPPGSGSWGSCADGDFCAGRDNRAVIPGRGVKGIAPSTFVMAISVFPAATILTTISASMPNATTVSQLPDRKH